MIVPVTKDETAMGYFLCSKSESVELLKKAQEEATKILDELKIYYSGNIGINVYAKEHVMGYSIAGDLTVNGDICRTYDPVDLCFLELNELMLKRIKEIMRGDTANGE